jgi:sigma-E factor negative regulatory protein RseB
MFTDGLAVFSVFIDSDPGRSLPAIDANLGATVAVLTKADINNQEYAICVVGEIPRATANQIASAISLSPTSSSSISPLP